MAPLYLVLVFILSLSISIYVCPLVISAALKYGIVDKPNSELKRQREPVPYLGGLVIFSALLCSLAISFPFDGPILAVLLCSSLIVSVGLVDDLGTLVPRDKLIGQTLAAIILVKAGVKIDIISWPWPITEVVSVFWMVTCMNAFNIIDVSDGLASVAGIVGAIGFTVISVINQEPTTAMLALALLGSCLGFLWYNRSPARIYLGDTGSMLLGTLLGAMTLIGRYSETNSISAFIAPFTFLALPFFDLALVILARLIAGRKIYHGSPDHYAVRMKDHGFRPMQVVGISFCAGLVFISLGISSTLVAQTNAYYIGASTLLLGLSSLCVVYFRYPDRDSPRFPSSELKPGAQAEASTSSSLSSMQS